MNFRRDVMTRIRYRTLMPICGVVLSVGGLLSLLHDSRSPSSESRVAADVPIETPLELALEESPKDRQVTRVIEALVSQCMAKRGFQYQGFEPTLEVDVAASSMVGVIGARPANRKSWSTVARTVVAAPRRRSAQYGRALDGLPGDRATRIDREYRFFVAVPRHGCRAAAERKIYGDGGSLRRASLAMILQILNRRVNRRLESDREVRAAVASWASCMRRAGHPDVTHPSDVVTMIETSDFRRTLQPDLKCKGHTRLREVVGRRRRSIERGLKVASVPEIAMFQRVERNAGARAAMMTAASAVPSGVSPDDAH